MTIEPTEPPAVTHAPAQLRRGYARIDYDIAGLRTVQVDLDADGWFLAEPLAERLNLALNQTVRAGCSRANEFIEAGILILWSAGNPEEVRDRLLEVADDLQAELETPPLRLWIKHNGGRIPTRIDDEHTVVEVKFYDGKSGRDFARSLEWEWPRLGGQLIHDGGEIMEYRLSDPSAAPIVNPHTSTNPDPTEHPSP